MLTSRLALTSLDRHRYSGELSMRVEDPTTGKYIDMPATKEMPCGERAYIDVGACYPCYRCGTCGAVEGSVGMPRECQTPKN